MFDFQLTHTPGTWRPSGKRSVSETGVHLGIAYILRYTFQLPLYVAAGQVCYYRIQKRKEDEIGWMSTQLPTVSPPSRFLNESHLRTVDLVVLYPTSWHPNDGEAFRKADFDQHVEYKFDVLTRNNYRSSGVYL